MNAQKKQQDGMHRHLPAPGRLRSVPARPALFAVLFLSVAAILPAEALGSPDWGYALDLPEGYVLAERSGNDRYHFTHNLFPAELQIALYPTGQFKTAGEALSWVTKQLASTGTEADFTWRYRSAAIARLEFGASAGWALSVELAGGKGSLVMACFAPAERATELEPLIVSTLDAVFTDNGAYFCPGPMTAFAWPAEGASNARYRDADLDFEVPFDSSDTAANQSVVDREFSLLTAYLDTPRVYDAWKRYYRMIARDGWSRLAKASFNIGTRLPADSAELSARLLAWTQSFSYERKLDGSDFISLPGAFASRTGDCDSRALLLVTVLNELGVDAILLVSPEYSHALAAIDCPGKGARYAFGGKEYLIADTTAKVDIGLIAGDMADPSKWFAVSFYAFPHADQK